MPKGNPGVSRAGRRRGGASHPCPECGAATEVGDTRRKKEASAARPVVRRFRRCGACGHAFWTEERRVAR